MTMRGPGGLHRGAIVVPIIIGIAIGIAGTIIASWIFQPNIGPQTFKVYGGAMAAPNPAPTLVDQPVTVPYGAGPAFPPLSTSPKVPAADVTIVFTLSTGDATFNDGTLKKSVAVN